MELECFSYREEGQDAGLHVSSWTLWLEQNRGFNDFRTSIDYFWEVPLCNLALWTKVVRSLQILDPSSRMARRVFFVKAKTLNFWRSMVLGDFAFK